MIARSRKNKLAKPHPAPPLLLDASSGQQSEIITFRDGSPSVSCQLSERPLNCELFDIRTASARRLFEQPFQSTLIQRMLDKEMSLDSDELLRLKLRVRELQLQNQSLKADSNRFMLQLATLRNSLVQAHNSFKTLSHQVNKSKLLPPQKRSILAIVSQIQKRLYTSTPSKSQPPLLQQNSRSSNKSYSSVSPTAKQNRPLSPLKSSSHTLKQLFDANKREFVARKGYHGHNKDSHLQFEGGVLVKVLAPGKGPFWIGMVGDRIGYFPVECLQY